MSPRFGGNLINWRNTLMILLRCHCQCHLKMNMSNQMIYNTIIRTCCRRNWCLQCHYMMDMGYTLCHRHNNLPHNDIGTYSCCYHNTFRAHQIWPSMMYNPNTRYRTQTSMEAYRCNTLVSRHLYPYSYMYVEIRYCMYHNQHMFHHITFHNLQTRQLLRNLMRNQTALLHPLPCTWMDK